MTVSGTVVSTKMSTLYEPQTAAQGVVVGTPVQYATVVAVEEV